MSVIPPFPPLPIKAYSGYGKDDGGLYYDDGFTSHVLSDFENWPKHVRWENACIFAALWRDIENANWFADKETAEKAQMNMSDWDRYRRNLENET